jgi:hypothetical protein
MVEYKMLVLACEWQKLGLEEQFLRRVGKPRIFPLVENGGIQADLQGMYGLFPKFVRLRDQNTFLRFDRMFDHRKMVHQRDMSEWMKGRAPSFLMPQ